MKIAVVTDSSSDIYDVQEELAGIYKVPLQISCDEEIYLDGETMLRDEAYDLMAQGKVFQTSLPPLGRVEELYEQLIKDGYDAVYCVVLSEGLSSTFEIMQSTARTMDFEFHSFDLYSSGEMLLTYAKGARALLDKGYSVEEVTKRLEEARKHSATYVLPDDLKHLMRSGRMSKSASVVGGLLQIKPVLYLGQDTGGKMEVAGKPRTMSKALNIVVDKYIEAGVTKDYEIFVLHVRSDDYAQKLKALIEERIEGAQVSVKQLVTAVSIHVGLGGVGSQYTKKINLD